MNIPKSYEALAADLASEKILSNTLIGQKEAYMMLADKGRLDLATWKQKACEAAEREAALREELESIKASVDGYDSPEHAAQVADEMGYQCIALQQRLTERTRKHLRSCQLAIGKSQLAKELQQRLTVAEQALGGMLFAFDDGVGREWSAPLLDFARTITPAAEFVAALKPAAEGEGS